MRIVHVWVAHQAPDDEQVAVTTHHMHYWPKHDTKARSLLRIEVDLKGAFKKLTII